MSRPASSTRTSTSTSPAAPSGKASTPRPAAAAAGGVTTLVDMPLNCLARDDVARGARGEARAARGQVHRRRRLLGRRGPWQRGRADRAGAGRRAGRQGVPVPRRASTSSRTSARRPARGDAGAARSPACRCSCTPSSIRRSIARRRRRAAPTPLPGVAAARVGGRGDRAADRRCCRETGCPRAHRPPRRRRARCRDRAGPRRRPAAHRRDLPALPRLEAEAIPDGATQFKCAPPIRERANREALWAALLEGVIDCIVSDHCPCTPALKLADRGDFSAAWGGIASLQLGLAVGLDRGGAARGARLDEMAALDERGAGAAGRPASIARGGSRAGYDADIVVWDAVTPFTVAAARLVLPSPDLALRRGGSARARAPDVRARPRGLRRRTGTSGRRRSDAPCCIGRPRERDRRDCRRVPRPDRSRRPRTSVARRSAPVTTSSPRPTT